MYYYQLAFHFLSVRRDFLRAARHEAFLTENGCWRREDWHRTQKERAVLNAVRYIIRNVLDNEGRATLSANIRQINGP